MRRTPLMIASIVPALVAGTLVCTGAASAASAPPMSVSVKSSTGEVTSYFTVRGAAGEEVAAGSLGLRNQTGHRINIRLDPVGGLTASTLGSAYRPSGTKQRGAANWLILDQSHLVLGPGGSVRVPVDVRIRPGARPGDYLAGVSVQAVGEPDRVQVHGNVAISQTQRYAIGVQVDVPGRRHPMIKLTGVGLKREPAGVTFRIKGRNSGNVILQNVRGLATISDGRRVVARRKLGPGTFVTGTSIAYPLLVSRLEPTLGASYRVRAYLKYKGGVARVQRNVSFGEIDAMRQQSYGGPKVKGSDDGNSMPMILFGCLIAAFLAALTFRGRRHSERALRRQLPRQISKARASGEPLSAVLVLADARRDTGNLWTGVRNCLRRSDRMFHWRGSSVVVVAPDTGPQAGEALAAELRRQLSRGEAGAPAVIAVTDAAQRTAERILHAAAAGASANGAQTTPGRRAPSEVNGSGTEAASAPRI